MPRARLLGIAMIAGLFGLAAGPAAAGELATAVVQSPGAGESASFDGSWKPSGKRSWLRRCPAQLSPST